MLPDRDDVRKRCRDVRKEKSSSIGGGRPLLLGIPGRARRECDGVNVIPLPQTLMVVRGAFTITITFGFRLVLNFGREDLEAGGGAL